MMKIYNSLEEYQPHPEGACAALGYFDGVHLGHRAVIESGVKDSGGHSVVLTFCESPAKALGKEAPPLLSDNAKKAELMEALGVDALIFADFYAVKDMTPAEFVEKVLVGRLKAKKVCCGFNYRFGHNGAGDTAALEELCKERGIAVCVCEPVYCDGEPVSSSLIRDLITGGAIDRANRLLGYRFAIEGSIGIGNRLGTQMGFPTLNLPITEGTAVPRFGVYASDVYIDGVKYRGATNIGVHPTVGENEKPLCETFLPDFGGGDLYGRRVRCELKRFIRPEMRFASVEELTEQIRKDCRNCY